MFDEIVRIIKKSPHHLELTDEMVEELYKAGAKHGLFKSQNLGFHDRKNKVFGLMSTLADLNKTTFI